MSSPGDPMNCQGSPIDFQYVRSRQDGLPRDNSEIVVNLKAELLKARLDITCPKIWKSAFSESTFGVKHEGLRRRYWGT